MKKLSANALCPCGSGSKYKKCCQPYHKGARPKNALILMKSRYTAYAVGQSRYIIDTTHPDNPDYSADTKAWLKSIDDFCQETAFLGLEIVAFDDDIEEAYVTFKAKLNRGQMIEKSRFLLTEGRWLYVDGEIR